MYVRVLKFANVLLSRNIHFFVKTENIIFVSTLVGTCKLFALFFQISRISAGILEQSTGARNRVWHRVVVPPRQAT
jgi:hypothetical protein